MTEPATRRSAVREIVAEMVGRQVEDGEFIVSSGLLDSLSLLRLITRLEQKLQTKLPTARLQPGDFDSVDLIVELLEGQA